MGLYIRRRKRSSGGGGDIRSGAVVSVDGFEVGKESKGSPRSESLDWVLLKLKVLRIPLKIDMKELPEVVVEACEEVSEFVFVV